MSSSEWVGLVLEFLGALAISKNLKNFPQDFEDEAEVDAAKEKMCLREICRKYEKIVDRWEKLEPLPLEEATRCNLYGFLRATVLLSASALENRFRVLTKGQA